MADYQPEPMAIASYVATAVQGAISRLAWLSEGPLPHEEAQTVLSMEAELSDWLRRFGKTFTL